MQKTQKRVPAISVNSDGTYHVFGTKRRASLYQLRYRPDYTPSKEYMLKKDLDSLQRAQSLIGAGFLKKSKKYSFDSIISRVMSNFTPETPVYKGLSFLSNVA